MKRMAVSLALVAALAVVGACGAEPTARKDKSPQTTTASSATQECGTESGTGCAPKSERVDLAKPSFSDPTNVTNPLFPVSKQDSVLLLGQVDGKAFRTEVTLLPETRIIEWQGQQVETLVSQYVAYLDGRIHEVAYDFYAQAARVKTVPSAWRTLSSRRPSASWASSASFSETEYGRTVS